MTENQKSVIRIEYGWDPHAKCWCAVIRRNEIRHHWPELARRHESIGAWGTYVSLLRLMIRARLKKLRIRADDYELQYNHAGRRKEEGQYLNIHKAP